MGRHSIGEGAGIGRPDVIVPADHYTERGQELAAEFDAAEAPADGIVEVDVTRHAHGS